MGYRSNVALAIKAEKIKYFLKAVALQPSCRDLFEASALEIFTEFDDIDDENGIVFVWENIKWYSSYEDVQLIDKYIKEMDNSDELSSYYLVRVGDEADDMECRGGWWTNPFNIQLISGFTFDKPNSMSTQEFFDLDNRRSKANENRYDEILKEI